MSGDYPSRGTIGLIEPTYYDLTRRVTYVATYLAEDVDDAAEAFDLYVGNPEGSGSHILVGVSFSAGGAAHIETGENATVDTAGTDLTRHSKGKNGTGNAVIEQGGTYTSENTLNTLIAGSQRGQQPSGSSGADELPDVRLLRPGEAVQYTVTNRSGNTVDFDAVVNATEVDA